MNLLTTRNCGMGLNLACAKTTRSLRLYRVYAIKLAHEKAVRSFPANLEIQEAQTDGQTESAKVSLLLEADWQMGCTVEGERKTSENNKQQLWGTKDNFTF